MSEYDTIEISVEVRQLTDMAMLIFDGARECWIPNSQIIAYEPVSEPGETTEIVIPEWLAYKKGLI